MLITQGSKMGMLVTL